MDLKMNTDTPLIYTAKGNLPISSLNEKKGWDFTNTSIVYWEEYYQGDELVKRNAAVFQLPEGTCFNLQNGNLKV